MNLYTEKVAFGPLRSRLLTGGLVGAGLGLANAARTDNGTGGLGHYMSGAMTGAGYGGLVGAAASRGNIRAAERAFSAAPALRGARGASGAAQAAQAAQAATQAARPASAAARGPRFVTRAGAAGSSTVDRATGDMALRAWGAGGAPPSPTPSVAVAQPAARAVVPPAQVAAAAPAKPLYRARQETQVLGARPAAPAAIPSAPTGGMSARAWGAGDAAAPIPLTRAKAPAAAPVAATPRPASPQQLYRMRADTQVLGARPAAASAPAAIAPTPDQVPMNPSLMQRMTGWINARRAPAPPPAAAAPGGQSPGLVQRMTGWINARRAPAAAPAPSAADARWQRLLAETAPGAPATNHRFQPPAARPAPSPVYRAAPRAIDPITPAHARYAPSAAYMAEAGRFRNAPIPEFGAFDPSLFSNVG